MSSGISLIKAGDGLVFVMRFMLGLLKAAMLLAFIAVMFEGAGYAQTARKFGNKPITVRLCPATCVAVNGHGFKPGGATKVYETRSGWARVSGYLDRAKLVTSFGSTITQKPALWVPVSQLASTGTPAPKKAAGKKKPATKAKPKPKRIDVVTRLARLRNVPLPTYRPNSTFQRSALVETQPTVVETPAEPIQPKPVEVVETKPVVVDSQPLQEKPAGDATSRALTWEELQAKLAAQAAQAKQQPVKSEAEQAAETERAKQAAREAAREAEARRQAEIAAKAREAKRLADLKEAEKAEAEKQARLKREAEAQRKAAEAKAAADKAAAAAKTATDKAAAEKAAAEAAKKDSSETVKFTPPKDTEQPKAEEKVAVALPPKKEEEPVPTYKSAEADPIVFGERPKKLTKRLLDKRLRKLPGPKSRVRKEAVIALRHYALGLLNSGECKGILKGGASAVPGMLYVACTDDPTYLRQFPLKEEQW